MMHINLWLYRANKLLRKLKKDISHLLGLRSQTYACSLNEMTSHPSLKMAPSSLFTVSLSRISLNVYQKYSYTRSWNSWISFSPLAKDQDDQQNWKARISTHPDDYALSLPIVLPMLLKQGYYFKISNPNVLDPLNVSKHISFLEQNYCNFNKAIVRDELSQMWLCKNMMFWLNTFRPYRKKYFLSTVRYIINDISNYICNYPGPHP